MPRRAPLIKSTAGQVIAVIVIVVGGLLLWDAMGRPGPRRPSNRGVMGTAILGMFVVLIATIPFSVERKSRWLSIALSLPAAALLAWATVAVQRATNADITSSIIYGTVFTVALGGMMLLDTRGRR